MMLSLSKFTIAAAPLLASSHLVVSSVSGKEMSATTKTVKKQHNSFFGKGKHHRGGKKHCQPLRPICAFYTEPENVEYWKSAPVNAPKPANATAYPEVAKYGMAKPWYFADKDFNVTSHHGDKKKGHGHHKGPHHGHHHGHHGGDKNHTEPAWKKFHHPSQICQFGHKRGDNKLGEQCIIDFPEKAFAGKGRRGPDCGDEALIELAYFACECVSEEEAVAGLTERAEPPMYIALGVFVICALLSAGYLGGCVRLPRKAGGHADRLISDSERNSEAGEVNGNAGAANNNQAVYVVNADPNSVFILDGVVHAPKKAEEEAFGIPVPAQAVEVTPSAFSPARQNVAVHNNGGLDTMAPSAPVVHVVEGQHRAESSPANAGSVGVASKSIKMRVCYAVLAILPGFAALIGVFIAFPTSGVYFNGC